MCARTVREERANNLSLCDTASSALARNPSPRCASIRSPRAARAPPRRRRDDDGPRAARRSRRRRRPVPRLPRPPDRAPRDDGRRARGADPRGAIQVRSIQKFFTHRPVSTFDRVPFQLTGELFLYGTALSVSGAYLLTCGKDRTFRLWNPFKGALIKTYTGHAHEVRDVSCARDNAKMTTGGGDKQVFLWDVATGQKIRRFRGHDAAVNAVSFAADDQVVVSAGYDRAVKFWDVRSNSIDAIQSVCAWKDSVTSLAITRNHCVTAASVDGSIRTMDLRAGRATADALGSEHPITSVRASGDERCFLLSVLGGRCVLLDRGDGDVLAEYRGHVHDEGAFVFTLVPIRPRWRGERRSLRPLPGVSLRPGSLAFNPRPRRLSTPHLTPFNGPQCPSSRGSRATTRTSRAARRTARWCSGTSSRRTSRRR